MKQLALLTLFALLLACSSSRKAVAELNGNWELVMFPTGTKTLTEIFTMKKPELQLENGRLSGTTGCNRINGNYTTSGNTFHIENNLAVTKMGCPNYDENVFLDALGRINQYQLKNNDLMLMHDSVLVMTFSKQ